MLNNEWPGQERRFPSKENPCKHTLDRIRQEIINFATGLPEGSRLLDFGCGEKPYYPFFQNKVSEYVGVDVADSPEKNDAMNQIIRQGEKIPLPSEYFDAVISTQVYEHLSDPVFYSTEILRVLKPGGKAFVSSAFAWDYHPYPQDFWRITRDAYQKMFPNVSELKFSADTNSLQTIIQSINLLRARKQKKGKFLFRLINWIISKIDYQKGDQNLPANIFVFVKK